MLIAAGEDAGVPAGDALQLRRAFRIVITPHQAFRGCRLPAAYEDATSACERMTVPVNHGRLAY